MTSVAAAWSVGMQRGSPVPRMAVALCMGRAGRTWSARWTSRSWLVRGSPAAVHVQVPGGLVCGSDHITYQNICTFQEAVCETEEQNLSFTNDGPCQAVPQIKHCLQHQMIVLGHDVIFICEIFAYPMALMEQKRDKEEFALLGDDPHISVQKWRKFWGALYRESACSCAHLELFEGSGPPTSEKTRKVESGKKLIKLSNCVHVAEAIGETSSPKETVPFILETTDKRYLLAAEGTEVADWILTLCDLAFARNKDERKAAMGKDSPLDSLTPKACSLSMEENSLYSSTAKATTTKEFRVTVRATESTERCRLWGSFILHAGDDALELQDLQTGDVLYAWPYKFLRRFGRDKVTFSFEAGRRCASGEGNFEFETRQGNEIFQVIESAINVQRGLGADEPRWSGPTDDGFRVPVPPRTLSRAKNGEGSLLHHTASTKCLSLESSLEGKPTKGKSVKPTNSCPLSGEPTSTFSSPADYELPYAEPRDSLRLDPQGKAKNMERAKKAVAQAKGVPESDYAVPFDTIAKTLLGTEFGSFLCGFGESEAPYSLYDSVDEMGGEKRSQPTTHTKPEHIYDEPEGLSGHSVYDEPEEVRGEAWKLQATTEDPVGHEFPYSPQRDDYAVPKKAVPIRCPPTGQEHDWLRSTEYDNVALRFAKKKNVQ